MATGDQADIFARLKAILPARWFGSPADSTPILDAVLQGVANLLAFVYSLYAYAKLQTRISTATDGYLDLIAADFFGTTLQRNTGQSDESYRALILANLFREKATRNALIRVLQDFTGQTPVIVEPTKPADCGAYGQPFWCYGSDSGTALAQARFDAADAAAKADIAAGGQDAYIEIGDINGNILFAGSYGSAGAPTRTEQHSIASASKPFYSALLIQRGISLSASDWQALTMSSGYHNMLSNHCSPSDTVDSCAMAGSNANFVPGDVGRFAYDGEPFQIHADLAMGFGTANNAALTAAYRNSPTGSPAGLGMSNPDTGFSNPGLAGGMKSTAADLAKFCVNVLNGTLLIGDVIYSRAHEIPASTYYPSSLVLRSPANPLEPWTFGPWWRDPINGSFLGAGSFGCVFGITGDRKYYYVVMRAAADAGGEMGTQSITTARNVLNAFLTATATPKAAGFYGSMNIPYQAFVQAFRPLQNLPVSNVSGYGISTGAYNTASQASYIDLQQFADSISDADIYAAIDAVKPAGTQVWVHINDPVLN